MCSACMVSKVNFQLSLILSKLINIRRRVQERVIRIHDTCNIERQGESEVLVHGKER